MKEAAWVPVGGAEGGRSLRGDEAVALDRVEAMALTL